MTPRRPALTSVSATRGAGTGSSVARESLRQRGWLRPFRAGSASAGSSESTDVVLRICQFQHDIIWDPCDVKDQFCFKKNQYNKLPGAYSLNLNLNDVFVQVLLFCSISYSSSSISFRTLSVTPVPDAHASIGPQVGPPVATWTTPERAVGHCVWWPSPPDAKASASKRCHKHSTFVDGKKSCSMLILRIYQYIYIPYTMFQRVFLQVVQPDFFHQHHL